MEPAGSDWKVLVSGASGFIGQALIQRLRSSGAEVHQVVRTEPRPGEAGIDVSTRTLDTSQLPGESLDSFDVIFHLAGEPITPVRWSPKKKHRIHSSRVVSTDILARALARTNASPKVFVCASAVGIYGDRADELLDERSPAGTGFLAEVCRDWEAATAPARDLGHRVVNVRSGVVLGAGGGALRAQLPLFRAGLGGRIGTGRQWTSWISLEDEVSALIHVAQSDAIGGPCNLTAPNPVRNSEYTRTLARLLHRPGIVPLPKRLIELTAGKRSGGSFLLASQRVQPRKLEESGFQFTHRVLDVALAVAMTRQKTDDSQTTTSGSQP